MNILDEVPVDFEQENFLPKHVDENAQTDENVTDDLAVEEIEETTTIEETPSENGTEEELPETEPAVINYEDYAEVGTPEEVRGLLDEILGENPSEAEVAVALKFLERAKKEEIEDRQAVLEKARETEAAISSDPGIPADQFAALRTWLSRQPVEVQEAMRKKTDYGNNSAEDIRTTIIELNNKRLASVRTTSSKGPVANTPKTLWTREKIMDTYESLGSRYYGAELNNKIQQLKSSVASSSTPEVRTWAKGFFGK